MHFDKEMGFQHLDSGITVLSQQGHRANGKKPLPGRVLDPKKGTKMVPKSESFQKEFFCSVAKKKSQKLDWTLS